MGDRYYVMFNQCFRRKKMHVLLMVLTALIATPLKAEVKIGYVDVQKALQSTKAGIAAKTRLESEIEKIKKEISKEEGALKKQSDDLKRKEAVLSRDVLAKQQAELQKKFVALQQKVAESQLKIQKKEQELTRPILSKIINIANKIGTTNGYDLILQKNEVSLLWGKASLDLTDQVMKEVDKK